MRDVDPLNYDEFALFGENVEEFGLEVEVPPVSRFFLPVDGLRQLSGLRWGEGEPELVLLHGGAQNAHTFDTVALALGRPLLALDLPGHGHSDPTPYPPADVAHHAHDLATALEGLLDRPLPIVGMSLGGLCAIELVATHPELARALVMVDITPGVTAEKARHVTDFVNGPATFADFEEILARTVAHHPTRSVSSLRRGILHNALRREDGSWVWRHQRGEPSRLEAPRDLDLWGRLEEVAVPVTLVRAMGEGSVVDDADEAELRRRVPDAAVVRVEGSGHSVQGDRPVELAAVLEHALF